MRPECTIKISMTVCAGLLKNTRKCHEAVNTSRSVTQYDHWQVTLQRKSSVATLSILLHVLLINYKQQSNITKTWKKDSMNKNWKGTIGTNKLINEVSTTYNYIWRRCECIDLLLISSMTMAKIKLKSAVLTIFQRCYHQLGKKNWKVPLRHH